MHSDMHSLAALIPVFVGFAFIQNINNFVLSAVTHFRGRSISTGLNFLIALLSAAATGIAVLLGTILKSQASRMGFDAWVDVAARAALIVMGLWMMGNYIQKWLKHRPDPAAFIEEQAHGREWDIIGSSVRLGSYESILLGLIMASDNLGISSFFGLINPLPNDALLSGTALALLTGIFSFVAVGVGQLSGYETRKRFVRMPLAVFYLEVAASVLIIVFGVYDPVGVLFGAAAR